MIKRKTWEEMKKDYPNEWLLIIDIKRDKEGKFKSGIVFRHSPDQDEAYHAPLLNKSTVFRFTGESTFSGLRSHAQISHSI